MGSIRFAYSSYYKLCKERGTPSDDVFGYVYTADYRAIKKGASPPWTPSRSDQEGVSKGRSPLQPFLTRNMVARRLGDDDPIMASDPSAAPLGCYVVHEQTDRRGKLWLFFVFPDVKRYKYVASASDGAGVGGASLPRRSEEREVVAADHFSFVVNPDAPERSRLQLHRTEYVPLARSRAEGVAMGTQVRIANHLPLAFDLPLEPRVFANTIVRHAALVTYAAQMHAMLSEPLQPAAEPPAAAASGGGGRRRPPRRHAGQSAYRRKKLALRDEPIESFADVWTSLPLHRVTVLVRQSGDVCDVTALLTDRLSPRDARHNPNLQALALRLPTSVARVPHKLEAALAAQLARCYTWDSFDDRGSLHYDGAAP